MESNTPQSGAFVFVWFFHTLSRMVIQIASLSGIGCVFYNLSGRFGFVGGDLTD